MTFRKFYLPRNPRTLMLAAFLIALCVRGSLIALTPRMNQSIDICIYSASGLVVSHGIDPYSSEDGKEVRRELRERPCSSWLAETQARWDYYITTNLPLSLMLYGGIDKLFPSSRLAFRIGFALADALLSALIVGFVFRVWKLEMTQPNAAFALALGALALPLLWWGTVIPEDKGIQSLLMIGAIMTARKNRLIASALCVGASIAFKGLGIFIAPLCLLYIMRQSGNESLLSRRTLVRALTYTALVAGIVVICFAPFFPEVLGMMKYRLATNLGAPVPGHGSIWRLPHLIIGDQWTFAKSFFIVFFLTINAALLYKSRHFPELLTASMLLLFVDVSLLGGSTD